MMKVAETLKLMQVERGLILSPMEQAIALDLASAVLAAAVEACANIVDQADPAEIKWCDDVGDVREALAELVRRDGGGGFDFGERLQVPDPL